MVTSFSPSPQSWAGTVQVAVGGNTAMLEIVPLQRTRAMAWFGLSGSWLHMVAPYSSANLTHSGRVPKMRKTSAGHRRNVRMFGKPFPPGAKC